MQGDQRQLAGFDSFNDLTALLSRDLAISNMPPPDENLGRVERLGGEPLIGVIEPHGLHTDLRLLAEIPRNRIPQKLVVGLFLSRLLLVPHHDANGIGGDGLQTSREQQQGGKERTKHERLPECGTSEDGTASRA